MTTSLRMWLDRQKSSIVWWILFTLTIILGGCSSPLKLTSDWRQGDIVIDGNDSEWQSGLYYDKESDIVYGVRNDGNYVYIFLKTQNRSTQMQIMGSGFTVWFDAEGGTDQTFGIRYPLGHLGAHTEFHPDADEEQMRTSVDQSSPELEILGPKKENVQRFSVLEVPGIRAKVSHSRMTLVYELCVPLKKTSEHPFAIGQTASGWVGIEFETGGSTSGQMKSAAHLDRPGGSGEPNAGPPLESEEQRGRGYGRGQRGGAQEGKEKPKQMELWLSVQLAEAPSAEQK